jgi:hypothetical protein
MPKALERKLKAQARKKGFTGKRADRYVYGTLRKTGWKPSHQKHNSPTFSSLEEFRKLWSREKVK